MKWTRNQSPGPEYLQSDGYMVNKSDGQYMAVRLGKERRTARGELLWEGSVILGVVDTADGAKQLCEVDSERLHDQQ